MKESKYSFEDAYASFALERLVLSQSVFQMENQVLELKDKIKIRSRRMRYKNLE